MIIMSLTNERTVINIDSLENNTYGWAEGVKVGASVGELVGRRDGLLVGATEGL